MYVYVCVWACVCILKAFGVSVYLYCAAQQRWPKLVCCLVDYALITNYSLGSGLQPIQQARARAQAPAEAQLMPVYVRLAYMKTLDITQLVSLCVHVCFCVCVHALTPHCLYPFWGLGACVSKINE